MCRLRFFEIFADLGRATFYDFDILSFFMGSLSISVTSPATLEHLVFNVSFSGHDNRFDHYEFYRNLRDADVWTYLDSISTHPTGSRLQRVDVNIRYAFRWDDDVCEPDEDEVLKAVLDGLPLLRAKGILFVKANGWEGIYGSDSQTISTPYPDREKVTGKVIWTDSPRPDIEKYASMDVQVLVLQLLLKR